MVSITTELKSQDFKIVINKIQKACKTNPDLSPRTKNELMTACKDKTLIVAMNNSSLVGWVLRLPYTNGSQEIAAAYVVDSHRSKGVFTKLVNEATKQAKVSLLVTFNKKLANYLINKQDFKRSSLWGAVKISKGQFLFDRLNINRLIAIAKHFSKSNPTYLIFNRND